MSLGGTADARARPTGMTTRRIVVNCVIAAVLAAALLACADFAIMRSVRSARAEAVGRSRASHVDMPVPADPQDFADSALLCVNARLFMITDVSNEEHRMIGIKKDKVSVPCTGGVTLTVDDAGPEIH